MSGLKRNNVRGGTIALILPSEERGNMCSGFSVLQASLREVQVGVWGMKKELVCFLVWCLCQSAFFGCKQQNQLWLSCRNCISRTVGNSGITREGREGALRRVRSQDNPRSLSQQWLNISCFCLFVFFNLCYTAFKIQDSRKKNQTVLYESLFHP